MPGKKICYNCTTKIKKDIEKNKNYDCCCDPFKRHRLTIKHNLILIDKCTSDKLTSLINMTICGYKVFQFCFSTIHNSETNSENAASNEILNVFIPAEAVSNMSEPASFAFSSSETPVQSSYSNGSEFISNSQEVAGLNEMFTIIGIPPLKRQKQSNERLIKEATDSLQMVMSKVADQITKVYCIKLPTSPNLTEMHTDSRSLHSFIENLQSKYNQEVKIYQKIRLLNLIPSHWTFQTTFQYFKCSRYMYSEACRLRKSKGKFFNPLRPGGTLFSYFFQRRYFI